MEGFPRDWPEGHRWVDDYHTEDITCLACRSFIEAAKVATEKGTP
jgi:hypothetical protein